MDKAKVSVLLLAHNEPRFVGEAINSILNQTYRNIELIVIDDGSTDDTLDVLARFNDPRMRVLRQPNLWIGFARNRGVSMAGGEYVAAMSHDDVSLPHRLATQIEAMERDNLDVCFSWAQIIDGEGRPADHFLGDVFNQSGTDSAAIMEKLKRGNFLLAPSVVCRRECYYHFASNVVLFGLQDYALWLQMLRRYRARVLETPLLKYRVHDRNVSLWRFSDEYRQIEALAAQRLGGDPPFPRSPVARASLARELLATTRRLSQNSDGHVEAYIAANRAVNLDPTAPEGYHTLASLLSEMGHDEPAQVVRSIGQRVDQSVAYPLPLLAPVQSSMRESIRETHRVESITSASALEGEDSSIPSRHFEEERDYLRALLRLSQEEQIHSQSLLQACREELAHSHALMQTSQEEQARLQTFLLASQEEQVHLQALLRQSHEERDRVSALSRQFEDELISLRTQARHSEEERDRLQVALRLAEKERDALCSHLRAVANGKTMRLLNALAGVLQKGS